MLDNLRIFITAAEKGSISETAVMLNMTIATVSRRIAELERSVGVELFHRSNRGLTLTSNGNTYYRECADSVNELSQKLINLDATLNDVEGPLRVVAPVNIGSGPLNNFWQSFSSAYPQIELNITLVEPNVSVLSKQPDIAVYSGRQENSSLIQTGLGSITPILVGAFCQSASFPQTPQALNNQKTIAADIFSDWTLQNLEDKSARYTVVKTHTHFSNDLNVSFNLAKAGAGIALLPKSMVLEALKKRELTHVLPQWHGPPRKLYLAWPYQKTLSARARLFCTALTEFLREQPWIDTL